MQVKPHVISSVYFHISLHLKLYSTFFCSSLSSYQAMHDDEIMDEENVNWCLLLSRLAAIVLLVVMCVFFGIGDINSQFFYLAGIVVGVLVLVFLCSFLDMDSCKSKYIERFSNVGGRRERPGGGGTEGTKSSTLHSQNASDNNDYEINT